MLGRRSHNRRLALEMLALVLLIGAGCRGSDRGERPDSGPSSTSLRLAGELAPGPYAVGFERQSLPLAAGSLGESTPSALDLYLWWPRVAPQAESAPLRFADYYRAQEVDPPDRAQLREWLLQDMTTPPAMEAERLDEVLDAVMWAHPGGEPAPGRHPLLLWSYRDSIPTMQAVLNEYLASHGYVVAFVWPTDHVPPFAWQEGLTKGAKLDALDAQVGLLGAALDALATRTWVDGQSTALLSWSYGGESAGALARQRDGIRLVVGIDSTLASGWIYRDAAEIDILDRGRLDTPYALIRHGRPRLGAEETAEPPLLSEIPAGAWFVRLPLLSHGNFNFPGGMVPGVLGLTEVSDWAVGGAVARRGYETMCRYVLAFSEHYLEGTPTPLAQPADERADGLVEVRQHPATVSLP